MKAVAGISGGIPRLINTLCDRALEAAYERQVRIVDPDSVIAAAERLRLEVPGGVSLPGARPRAWLIAAGVALLAILAGVTWWLARPASTPGSGAAGPPSRSAPRIDTEPAAGSSASSSTASAGFSFGKACAQSKRASHRQHPDAGVSRRDGGASVGRHDSRSRRVTGAPRCSGRRVPDCGRRIQDRIARSGCRDGSAAMQVPATVRLDPTGSWYRVMAGPFVTRENAQVAQAALERAGYDGTRISQIASDPR